MDWDLAFTLVNCVALAAWLVLIAGPGRPALRALVLQGGVGALCVAYIVLLAGLVSGVLEPQRDPGAQSGLPAFSLVGVKSLFASRGGIVLGWTHYLALDLLAGLWIAREADAARLARVAQAPLLLATFLSGPLGLGAWLVLRRRYAPVLEQLR
jgi:hypothetical protein